MSDECFEILVVDDNPNNLKLVRKLLSERNYKVRISTSGEMALKSVESSIPDLILLDITMPGMSGFETCQALKSKAETKDIPVIFLSALKEENDIIKGFEVGGVDFVTKPFRSEILLARIKTHTTLSHLQKTLSSKNETLEKNYQELQSAQEHLIRSQKMSALGKMVKGISHELNTPIGVSITGVSALESSTKQIMNSLNKGDLTQSELLNFLSETNNLNATVLGSLRKAVDLVNFFKQVSIEEHHDASSKFNLYRNFDDSFSGFKKAFEERNIVVKNEIPSHLDITSFPGIFYQIYNNLLNNVYLHAFEKKREGTVLLGAEKQQDNVLIRFEDNGQGMEDDVQEQLYDAFFTTKRGQGGTGLGMNIVYTLVTEKLAGSIDLESKVGNGSRFTISIPQNTLAEA